MARTTGYTATIIARQVLRGQFAQRGICPPENIGRDAACYADLLAEYDAVFVGRRGHNDPTDIIVGSTARFNPLYSIPLVMVIMFASFPSGLNLYWCFSNVLQIGQQYIVNEKIHKEKKEEEHEIKALKRKKGAKEK